MAEFRLRTIEDKPKNEDKDGTWNQAGRSKVDRDSTGNNRGQAEKRAQRRDLESGWGYKIA